MNFNFKPGDVINSQGDIGKIVDVLKSETTGNMVIIIDFLRNIGGRSDMLFVDLNKSKIIGIDKWRIANPEEIREAVKSRIAYTEKEAAKYYQS